MEETEIRKTTVTEAEGRRLLVETGHELLRERLVARTWGNISCRLEGDRFLITPSGLDYMRTEEEDIVRYDPGNGTWEGRRKPSSEKGIHAAAYREFPEAGFVIHTHQTFATALGLAGWDRMDITEAERKELGGIARAKYGLPGQKSLCENVTAALKTGARVVLMANHGALICGTDAEDTLKKAALLEEICRRNCRGEENEPAGPEELQPAQKELAEEVRKQLPLARICGTAVHLRAAERNRPLPAQLDDMAQMIGSRIPVSGPDAAKIVKHLRKKGAVLVPGLGCFVCGKDEDDTEALAILTEKAAVSAMHTALLQADARLSAIDVLIMNLFYRLKYSGQKEEKTNE